MVEDGWNDSEKWLDSADLPMIIDFKYHAQEDLNICSLDTPDNPQ